MPVVLNRKLIYHTFYSMKTKRSDEDFASCVANLKYIVVGSLATTLPSSLVFLVFEYLS